MQEQGLAGAIVLLLDDDALAREAIAGALRDLGGEVTSCANEAQIDAALAGGLLPELLVIDLRIDGELQGIAIAARARAKLAIPPPTIVITGDTGPETLAALRASGHAWLIKPVATHILAETIRMVRGGRAA
jgi:CheY-like chemotaxis protein